MSDINFLKGELESFSKIHTIEPSLDNLQKKSILKICAELVPHRKVEAWKYTNLNNELALKLKMADTKKSHIGLNKKISGFHNLFFIDGKLSEDLSDKVDIEITPITKSQITDKVLSQKHNFTDDILEVLNTSALGNGYVFTVKKSKAIDLPILIHNHFGQDSTYNNQTNIFRAEVSSSVKFLHVYTGGQDSIINCINYFEAEGNSSLDHTTLQAIDKSGTILLGTAGNAAKDARLATNHIHTGAKKSRSNISVSMTGIGSEIDCHGLYALTDDQHHDTSSYIRHAVELTHSHQLYKGILNGNSKGIFTGKVRVDKDAQLITAQQLNKNLILNKKAHAHSLPQMEIYADDVKCAHGSTTGQLSESELFYFESRGIRKAVARRMLANAFINDVVLKISNDRVQSFIRDHLKDIKVVE